MGVPVRAHDKRARSAIAFRYLTEELLERKGWRAPLALNHDSTQAATATLTAPLVAAAPVSAPTELDSADVLANEELAANFDAAVAENQ